MEQQIDPDEIFNPEGWKNPPTIQDLKQDQLDAKESHETQVAKIKEWLDNLHVRGDAQPKTTSANQSTVQPKLIRKQAEWRYAALSEPFHSTDDLFDPRPTTWEDAEGARQNKLLLNHQFNNKIDKVKFIDEYVRACVDEGTGIVKLAWEFEEEEVEVEKPIVDYQVNAALKPLHEELAAMREQNPTGYERDTPEELRMAHEKSMEDGVPYEAEILGYETVKETRTVKNQPSLEVCDSSNVIVDPSCEGDLDKAGFIIHSFDTNKSNLERAGIYSNLEQINVEANSPLNDPDHEDNSLDPNYNPNHKPRKRLIAYEYWGYWDFDDSGVVRPIVATWVGDTLIRLAESPAPDGKLPFVFVPTLPVKKSVYGEPDGELLVDNQKIIGAVTRGMIDVMGKSANGQMGHAKNALDAVNRRKFQKGQDYEYNAGVDPRMAFYMHTYPEIPASAQYMLDLQSVEAESMTGVKAFSQGLNSNSLGDVATGIRGAIDAAGKREMGILRRLKSGLIKIARKIMAMNAEFLEDEEIIRITNENFVAISRDVLAGSYDIHMDISTAEEDNVKAQELAFMLQTMGNNIDAGMVMLILRDIARLRKMPELAKQIEEYQPQPDPLEQQLKMLEIQKMRMEIAKLKSEEVENYADARKKNSEADNQDLSFVEQESGVTQERELERQGAQARANMELETHKANLAKGEDTEKPENPGSVSELRKYLESRAA